MKYIRLSFLLTFLIAGLLVQAQDSIKPRTFDYSKLKPIVHLFANAEYTPSASAGKDYSFWLGRMMFGFQYDFNAKWSSRVLIDRTRLPGSMNTMYVKVASLRWSPGSKFAIEAGAVNQTNYIPFETFYGYRYVAETFQDRYYGITSSDLGVIAYYTPGKRWSIDAAITNGEGPRIDQDNTGGVRTAGGVSFFPTAKVQTRLFGQWKSNGDPANGIAEKLVNGYIGIRLGERARVGVECTYINDFQYFPGVNTFGGTAFGFISLYRTLGYLVRFDRIEVNNPLENSLLNTFSQNAVITGLSVSPLKGINLCLNYQGSYPTDKNRSAVHRVLFSFEYRI
jgi:hypothetical protein